MITISTVITREDAFLVLEAAKDMHESSPNFTGMAFNPEKIWNILDATLKQPNKFFIVYAKDDETGKIVGGLIGQIVEIFFSNTLVAKDLGVFLYPEHRNGLLFLRFIREFEKWAWANSAQQIVVGHSTGNETEKAPELFSKLGYNFMGYVFNKEKP